MFQRFYQPFTHLGNQFQPFFLLILRIFWGLSLIHGGWYKWNHILEIREFFDQLHIPFPLFSAYFVGSIELLGGFLFIVGLCARLIAVPLTIIMIVALSTAHASALSWDNPYAILKESPFTFLLVCLTIFAFGPGKLSLDKRFRIE